MGAIRTMCGLAVLASSAPVAAQQPQQPNIVVIVGDHTGWFNIEAYHQGIMYSTTPNLDRHAAEGLAAYRA